MEKREWENQNGCILAIASFIALLILGGLKIYGFDISWWLIIGAALLIGIGMQVDQSAEAKNQKLVLKKQGIDVDKFMNAGKYIHGHVNLDAPFDLALLYIASDSLKIYKREPSGLSSFKADIPIQSIVNITMEDETTISKRVGLKRMLAIGVFAFAVKKKVKDEMAYLVIEWKEGSFTHETVFEFVGNGSVHGANSLRNNLIRSITIKNV